MNLIDYRRDLEKLERGVFHVKEAATALGVTSAYASQILKRLQVKQMAKNLKRGVWAISEEVDPFLAPEALSFPYKSYISFQTALHYHGIIEQIPEVIYVATLSRTIKINTPIGTYSFHHLDPKYFFDYERVGYARIPIATKEKALFDFLYLSYGKSKWFKTLPEIDIPKHFDKKKILKWVNGVKHKPRRDHLFSLLGSII